MKEGSGDDPFADAAPASDEVDEDIDDNDEDLTDETSDLKLDEVSSRPETTRNSDAITPTLPQNGREDSGVPWVYTRSNVKDSRDMVQFYLREAVQSAESGFVDEVSDQLGSDVSKTDVREAAYVAAMHQPEIVAEELERWGFESE